LRDYGRAVEFGFFLVPTANEYPTIADLARAADDTGLDLIGIQGHPPRGGSSTRSRAPISFVR
jgi:hypothetical protein